MFAQSCAENGWESRLAAVPEELAVDAQAIDATGLVLKNEASIVDPRRSDGSERRCV